jgi:hypothetical protein
MSVFAACSDSSFRLGSVFSRIQLAVDGEQSTQRNLLTYSIVADGRRVFVTITARLTGTLTSVTTAGVLGDERKRGRPALREARRGALRFLAAS